MSSVIFVFKSSSRFELNSTFWITAFSRMSLLLSPSTESATSLISLVILCERTSSCLLSYYWMALLLKLLLEIFRFSADDPIASVTILTLDFSRERFMALDREPALSAATNFLLKLLYVCEAEARMASFYSSEKIGCDWLFSSSSNGY